MKDRPQYRHLNEVGCLYPAEQLQDLYDQAQDPDELEAILCHLHQYDVADDFRYLHITDLIQRYREEEEL
ncbi:hypothetical protein [Ectobacillus ponti]|uniref:Uncharacterized protein n=1 Tax=Ectobacillus ponti TaxID=2961894 RepID=A0AA42BQS7_9BACI|nr:hypothetical protein [Ectobacillus ponti]MCP8970585.1 hypothetical protein [Ectobacillus ponti]